MLGTGEAGRLADLLQGCAPGPLLLRGAAPPGPRGGWRRACRGSSGPETGCAGFCAPHVSAAGVRLGFLHSGDLTKGGTLCDGCWLGARWALRRRATRSRTRPTVCRFWPPPTIRSTKDSCASSTARTPPARLSWRPSTMPANRAAPSPSPSPRSRRSTSTPTTWRAATPTRASRKASGPARGIGAWRSPRRWTSPSTPTCAPPRAFSPACTTWCRWAGKVI